MPPTDVIAYKLEIKWDGVNWIDETARLKRFRYGGGRDHELGLVDPGRFTSVLDDYDGRYTPEYTSGPLFGQLDVGVELRLTTDFNSVTYDSFFGLVSDIRPSVRSRTVAIEAIDRLANIADAPVRVAPADNSDVGSRISATLQAAGIAAGDITAELGATTLPFFGEDTASALALVRELLKHELGGNLFQRGDGQVIFHNRHYRSVATSIGIVTTPGNIEYDRRLDRVYDGVRLSSGSQELGVAGSTVWSHLPLPLAIGPGETFNFRPRYYTLVRDAIEPTSVSDYAGNAAVGGGGTDKTSALASSGWADYGRAASWSLTNNDSAIVYIQRARIRGTPVTTASGGLLVERGVAGRAFLEDYPWITDRNLLGGFADFLIQRFQVAQPFVELTLEPEDDDLTALLLGAQIDSRLTITDTAGGYRTNVSGDFFVERMEHRARVSQEGTGNVHVATFGLTSLIDFTQVLWVLGTSALGDDTVLGY